MAKIIKKKTKQIETYGFTYEQVYSALNEIGKYFFKIAYDQYKKGNYTDGIVNTVQAAFDITAQYYSTNGGKLVENSIDGYTFIRAAENMGK